jgi:hypothetical protein
VLPINASEIGSQFPPNKWQGMEKLLGGGSYAANTRACWPG